VTLATREPREEVLMDVRHGIASMPVPVLHPEEEGPRRRRPLVPASIARPLIAFSGKPPNTAS
jgi:hypothetical protein